jgi:hypothetical protein
MMPKQQRPSQAPGDEDLPDLAISMPLQYAQVHPETVDILSIKLLRPTLSYSTTSQHGHTHWLIPDASGTKHNGASASVKQKAHTGRGFDLGYDTRAKANDSMAWPGRDNLSCASCSKWSLACVHAAALNAFDEHDSESNDRNAAPLMQQLMYLQNRYRELEDHHDCCQHQTYQRVDSPMLKRWLNQMPRQEGFGSMVVAKPWSASAVKSRL